MVKRKCEFCEQEFEGINDKQVDSQLTIHKVTQHADKVTIRNNGDKNDILPYPKG